MDAQPYDLTGRVAVVTGAARGIGRACALRLARSGADVVVLDRDLGGAAQFGEELSAASVPDEIRAVGRRSEGFQVDLTDRSAVDRVAESVLAQFGRVDILVNMAGGAVTPADRSHVSQMRVDDVKISHDVNVVTMLNATQAFLPALSREGGAIVNATGQSAITTYKDGLLADYGAAKIAVLYYTRALAAEVGPVGVRANCVSPGVTLTARVASQAKARGVGTGDELDRVPLRRFAQPDDIAKAVEFLASDMSSYITGQCLSVCGGAVMTPC